MKAFILSGEWDPRPGHEPIGHRNVPGHAAAACQAWRSPLLEECDIEPPVPSGDEVLVRVKACGVCGSDLHMVDSDEQGYVRFSGPARLPVILGHEYAGEVAAVGSLVRALGVGEPVAAEGMLWCGRCEPCRRGTPNQCTDLDMVGFTAPGAFAEYILTRECYCWSLRPLLAAGIADEAGVFELGALLEPAGCAYNGLFVVHDRFAPGIRVAVFGVGPIGLAAVSLARAAGASLVVAIDPLDRRRELARAMGAHHALSPAMPTGVSASLADTLRDLTAGDGFDICVEAAGAAHQTVSVMLHAVASNGRIVYLGRTGANASFDLDRMVSGACAVAGARGHAGHGIYPNLIRMAAAGVLHLSTMITRRVSFPHVMDALAEARDRRQGKVMIVFP